MRRDALKLAISNARRAQLILAALGILFFAPQVATAQERAMLPTLITVIHDHDLPPPSGDLVDTAMTITSFGVVDDRSQFAVAYYKDTGTDELRPPLYVVRYDKSAQHWYEVEFSQANAVKAAFTGGFRGDSEPIQTDCFGSAGIQAVAGVLLVTTHLSPSAKCTIVLTPELKVKTSFSGWEIGAVSSSIIFQRSEVHFTATHPLRIAILDLASGREVDLYPPANDALRKDFQTRLAAVLDQRSCRENNASCDPQQMSTELGKVAVNERDAAIAFDVMFESEGFGKQADAEIGGEKYFYVFKLTPKIDYREFDEFDMKPMFGEASPNVLVRPEILHRLFAAK